MRNATHSPDFLLIIITAILILFGILMVYDASVVQAYLEFGDKLYFFKNHILGIVIGLVAGLVAYKIDFRLWTKWSLPLMVLGLILLIIVYIPGFGIKAYGSQRWLNLGLFSFQPSEIIKPIFAIYMATFLAHKKEQIKSFTLGFMPYIFITLVVSGLIFFQPDLGTAFQIFANGIFLLFLSNASLFQMGVFFPLASILGLVLIWISPYRRARLLSFLDPSSDVLGKAYHINQVLIALGSGGWFGLGFGASRQKFQYLPEVMTDSIFAVVGEELGFIGVLFVLAAFFFFIWRGLKITKEAPDQFSHLLAAGIIGWIGIQALINLGAMSTVLPLTGVPLPFISYGRSSTVSLLIGVGILLNISRNTLRKEKGK